MYQQFSDNELLSLVEHEIKFYNLGPDLLT